MYQGKSKKLVDNLEEKIKELPKLMAVVVLMLAISFTMAGCGGGGGDALPPQVSGVTGLGSAESQGIVSGVAAVGLTLVGQASIKDASTPARAKSTMIASDGSFAFDVSDMTGPFILQAVGSANGINYTLYSFSDNSSGTANINPFTNLLLTNAAGVADPAQVYANPDPATLQKIKSNLPAATAALQSKLKPLLERYGAYDFDPIKDHYVANRTGLDGLFDDMKISLSSGVLTIVSRSSETMVFACQINNIKGGQLSGPFNTPAVGLTSPADPTATGGDHQVTISWAPVPGAASYNIYYSSTAGVTRNNYWSTTPSMGTRITGVTSPYSHKALSAGTTYYYIVTAVNSAAEEGPQSVQVFATTAAPPSPAPVAPATVTAAGGVNRVTVTWPPVFDATSYNIYWSKIAWVTTGTGNRITNATTPYVLSGLADGTTSYFVITAVNSLGRESAPSKQAVATTAGPPLTAPAPAMDGAALYASYCSSCHGDSKQGRSADAIKASIAGIGVMSSIVLTDIQISAIAAAFSPSATPAPANTPPPSAGAPIDGAALYANYCAACHGSLANTAILPTNRNVAGINASLAAIGMMSSLKATLTADQIAAIAAVLPAPPTAPTTAPTTTTTPPDGAALYANYCAGCHGSLASTAILPMNRNVAGISAALATIGSMGALSVTMTVDQVAAIAAVLPAPPAVPSTTPPATTPTDGAALYTSTCQGCHGPLATPSRPISSRTVQGIKNAGMAQGFSDAQLQAIINALPSTSTVPTQVPAPVPAPVACGSCHAIPPTTGRHTYHYPSRVGSCGTCHGSGYSATAVNAATHLNGAVNIAITPRGTGIRSWNASTQSCSPSCHGSERWGSSTPATVPTTPATTPSDGATLYANYCAGCHGSLASTAILPMNKNVAGVTAALATVVSMSSLNVTLTAGQVAAIASALAATPVAPPTAAVPAPPSLACGTCHSIPPATGRHAFHYPRRVSSCGTCHGSGYSATAVNSATHNNGLINVATSLNWNASNGSCAPACHGSQRW